MWYKLTLYNSTINNNRFYLRWLYSISSEYRENYIHNLHHSNSIFNDINKTITRIHLTPISPLSLLYSKFCSPKINSARSIISFLHWRPNVFNFLTTKPEIIQNNELREEKSKFNLDKIVAIGFYDGLITRQFQISKLLSNQACTVTSKTIVNQLLDYVHSLYNSSYRKESLKLQTVHNDNNQNLKAGSFIQFEIPSFDLKHTSKWESNFLNEVFLIKLKSVMNSMDKLHSNINKILKTYGCLPITQCQYKNDSSKLMIFFPNKTALETETLVSDLEIKEGIVCESPIRGNIYSGDESDHYCYISINNSQNNNYTDADDILSSSYIESSDSIDSDIILPSTLSPILSQQSLESS